MSLSAHKKGLALLFSTEMWERFSYYAMRALLVLYMTARVFDGGLGWTKAEALELYALYVGATYIAPIFGGYLSDTFLGQRRATMIGAFAMCVGHFLMAFNDLPLFYTALVLIIIGNGFFKPCMTSILGQLYEDREESERDFAYSIFYTGINLGAALSGLVAGSLYTTYGFDCAFASAGVGMVISLLIFWWGKDRFLGDHGLKPNRAEPKEFPPLTAQDKSRLAILVFLFLVTILFMVAFEQIGGLVALFINERVDRSIGSFTIPTPWLVYVDSLFIIFFAPILGVLWKKLGEKERDPFIGAKLAIGCLLSALSFVVLHWMSQQVHPSWGWIILNKFILVLGELCFIPITWAAVSTLAPSHYISRMMGLMLAGTGIGAFLAGRLGSLVDTLGEQVIFGGLATMLVVLAVICLAINDKLKKMAHHPTHE